MSKKMDNFCLVSSFLLVFFAFFVFVNTARNIFFAVITSKEGIFRYVHRTPVAPFRTLGPAQCERCGCARARTGCKEGDLPVFSCRQGVASRRERRARGPPVPVLEMPLVSPQAAVTVSAAESPVCYG